MLTESFMLHKVTLFFFVFLTFFCETSYAETIVEKKVVRISLYAIQPWPVNSLPKLQLIITDNKIQKPTSNYSYGLDSDDPADIAAVDVPYPDNLFTLIPQEFINDSNMYLSLANISGGYLFYITFNDGSSNCWRIFPPNSESEQIQVFITKIDGILGHTLF